MTAPKNTSLARTVCAHIVLALWACVIFLSPTLYSVFSEWSVIVTARVWAAALAPSIQSISPSGNPVVVAKNSLQTFTAKVKTDASATSLNFTATPAVGMGIPESGTISVSGWFATVPFTFLAPSGKVWLTYITLTVQDSASGIVVSKRINLYVY